MMDGDHAAKAPAHNGTYGRSLSSGLAAHVAGYALANAAGIVPDMGGLARRGSVAHASTAGCVIASLA
jgi:hypothetical protein